MAFRLLYNQRFHSNHNCDVASEKIASNTPKPECYQKVQKPDSVMVSGSVSATGEAHFHFCDVRIYAER